MTPVIRQDAYSAFLSIRDICLRVALYRASGFVLWHFAKDVITRRNVSSRAEMSAHRGIVLQNDFEHWGEHKFLSSVNRLCVRR